MIEIHASPDEVAAGKLTDDHLEAAVRAVREDSFVVLHNAIDLGHIDALYEKFLEDRARLDRLAKPLGPGRGNQQMPREPEYLFEDVMKNPLAAQVMGAVYGSGVGCGMYTTNTNLPGVGVQELHIDQRERRADDPVGYPTNCFVMNVPLVDFTEENGATEVWPGTHVTPCSIGQRYVSAEEEETRRKIRPPEIAVLLRGSALLRDIRIWHRGRANHTDIVRTMIGMITIPYDAATMPRSTMANLGPFHESARDFFATGPVYYNVEFVNHWVDIVELPVK